MTISATWWVWSTFCFTFKSRYCTSSVNSIDSRRPKVLNHNPPPETILVLSTTSRIVRQISSPRPRITLSYIWCIISIACLHDYLFNKLYITYRVSKYDFYSACTPGGSEALAITYHLNLKPFR